MKGKYRRLTLAERVSIQECLDRGDSIRECAKTIGRAPSTVAREVAANRIRTKAPVRLAKCPFSKECEAKAVCESSCTSPGMACRVCTQVDCRTVCPAYAERTKCTILERAPHVCNHCRYRCYFCGRDGRFVYDARAADAAVRARRSDCRCGIDLDEDRAMRVLSLLREGLSRGLSPYEMSVLYEEELGVHRSTIYRWVERGYGGLSNMELERKVGFKPRKKDPARKASSHAKKRSYASFDELEEADLAVVMSHANSNPRESLCGMSPIGMFLAAYGDEGDELLDAFGIRQIARDEIVLTPRYPRCRAHRAQKDPLTCLK